MRLRPLSNFEKVKIKIELTLKVKQDGREGEPTDFLIWKEGDQRNKVMLLKFANDMIESQWEEGDRKDEWWCK